MLMKLLSYITILCAPIFTLFFFSSYREEKPLYIGGLCCFIAIIAISIIWAERKTNKLPYYGLIICNYIWLTRDLLFDSSAILLGAFLIPLFPFVASHFYSQNIKQTIIMDINAMFVIGFSERLALIHYGIDGKHNEGVTTVIIAFLLLLGTIISVTSLIIKYRKKESKKIFLNKNNLRCSSEPNSMKVRSIPAIIAEVHRVWFGG